MIGSGLKKLARENGMKVARGVAYGSLGGYAATLSEGAGWKQIVFTTTFPDPAMRTALMDLVSQTDVKKLYRVQNLGISPRAIQVNFLDNPGTMKKMYAFLDWFLPLLEQHGATPAGICTACGCEVAAGRWVLINGVAYHVHESCAQKAEREIADANTRRTEEDNGNYITGLLGALGGSAIGAILWGVVLYLGYVASLVGLVIGFLAEKGYNLLKGKQGKAKIVILIAAIIFGVVLGTVGAYGYALLDMVTSGDLRGFTAGDVPMLFAYLLANDPEYKSGMVGNILMGLFFAALGVFALLRQTGKAVADETFVILE